jgi:hypothetical protein
MPGKKNQKMNVIDNNVKSSVGSVQEPAQSEAVIDKKKRVTKKTVEAPVVVDNVQEVKVTKKSGVSKGTNNKTHEPVVVSAAPVESAAPVVENAAPVVENAAPVVESAAPVVETKKRQAGGRKKVEAVGETTNDVVAKKSRVPKAKKTDALPVEAVDATQTAGEVVVDDEKQIRSFKVKLPGSEQFEGRFTGLTPYQAANKALSKYFREGQREDGDVTFSICESTRRSKKSVYTYVGQRHKLQEPVKYTIQNGREIIKNFKNSLKKVKKAENTHDVGAV